MKKLFLILFLVVGYFANGQILQEPNVYGYKFKRVGSDSLHFIPSDTLQVPTRYNGLSFIANKGGALYYWNGTKWASFSSSGSSYTFTNGITESGGTVKLGGTISESIQIIGSGGGSLYIDSLIYFIAGAKSWPDRTAFFSYANNAAIQYKNSNNTHNEIALNASSSYIRSGLSITDYSYFKTLRTDSSARILSKSKKVYVDSLNATTSTTGKKIMLRDTATGLVQNIDPALIGGGTSAPLITANNNEISDSNYYTAFAFSYTLADTLHIIASQGYDHFNRMWLVDFSSSDGGKTFLKSIIKSHPDTSYRDAGGGVDSSGRCYVFYTKYQYTSPGVYSSNSYISVLKKNGNGYVQFQENLSRNGNAFAAAYGKIVFFGDTTIMTAYGGNACDVWLYQSINGGPFTIRSNVFSNTGTNNETCVERISSNTLVAISRTNGAPPKMFISHDRGKTWLNLGNVYGGVANNVSPWLQKMDDSTLTYVYGDRNIGAMFIRGQDFRITYLDTAITVGASQGATIRKRTFFESVLNNRATYSSFNSHFGYPSITKVGDEWMVIYNDLNPNQIAPWGGDNIVAVDLILRKINQRVILKAYNSAIQAFPTDVETRVSLNQAYYDTYGMLDGNNNITIPITGMYSIFYNLSVNNTTGGRRIIIIRKVSGVDTASTTDRKMIVYKEYSPGTFSHVQTLDASCMYHLTKGDIIKVSIQIYGASGPVTASFTQLPGGSNNGVFEGLYLFKIDD